MGVATTERAGAVRLAGFGARAGVERRLRVATLVQVAMGALVLSNLGRVPVLTAASREAAVFLNDMLVAAVLMAGAVASMRGRTWELDRPALLGVLFAALGALSAVLAAPRYGLSGFELFFSLLYLVRWIFYLGIYVVVRNSLQRRDVMPVWRAYEAGLMVFALFGIFQSLFLPGFAQMIDPTPGKWDPQGHRLVSAMLDPNLAGALILIGLLVQLAMIAARVKVPLWRVVVLVAALLMTVSRSSYVGAFVGGLVLLTFVGLSRRLFRVAGLLALLVIPFLPLLLAFLASFNKLSVDDPNIVGRVVSWLRALAVIRDNPVIGVGFNTYGFVSRAYGYDPSSAFSFSLDGGLLFIMVMTGAVGVALYAGIIGTVVARCRRIWRDVAMPAPERAVAAGTAAATIGMLVHSLFVNSLLLSFVMTLLWVLWGLTGVLARRDAAVAPRATGPRLEVVSP